jgi:PBP1b-binding outer membrane lipoprotein LpoB
VNRPISNLLLIFCFISGCSGQPIEPNNAEETPGQIEAMTEQVDPTVEQARLQEQMEANKKSAFKACVERVLLADSAANSSNRTNNQVAQAMRLIDTSDCPSDFRQAYEKHTYAWENSGKIEAAEAYLNSKESRESTIAQSIFETIIGSEKTPLLDHLAAERELARLKSIASQEIRDTFQLVRSSAILHDAKSPEVLEQESIVK